MAESLLAQSGAGALAESTDRPTTLDRLASFRVVYLAIFAFMVLYIVSVEVAETVIDGYFRESVRVATRVSPLDGPIASQIQNRVSDLVQGSIWTRWGGVRVNVTVIGADGLSPLYVGGGRIVPPPPAGGLDSQMREALRLLPAISDVFVSVSHGSLLSTSIFVLYGAVLLQGLFIYNRRLTRRSAALIEAAISARDSSTDRVHSIEAELTAIRERLGKVEPTEREQAREIGELEHERGALQAKLRELAQREAELRASADRASDLEEERRTLEELLDEALEDVTQRDGEITALQDRLKRAAKREPGSSSKSREADRLGERMRTLYKNLSFDDRAISDLVALRDETLRLRAEEGLKRLADDPDTAAVRRKVGGLPPHLSIFELGFAGKGRIYYTRADQTSGYRVLAVGAKNTQKQDLEYLSRLSL